MTTTSRNDSPSFWSSPGFHRVLVITVFTLVVMLLGYRLRDIITPLLVSLLIAYILDPFIDWVERRGVPRLAVVITVFSLLILTVVLAIVVIVPELVIQIEGLGGWLAKNSDSIRKLAHEHLSPERAKWLTTQIEKNAASYSGKVVQYLFTYSASLLGSAFTVINLVILIPIYTFFFLWRFDHITAVGARFLPGRYKDRIENVLGQINLITANFFRGRLMICLAVGVITAIGFQIVGVPFAWPLGLIIGVFNLVPYLAPFIGLPPILFISYISSGSWTLPMYAFIAFSVAQFLDGWILTPMVQGKSIGLHPITTIVVIFIGSELAGMFGLVLAIPAAAAIKIIFKEFAWPEIADAAGIDRQAIEEPEESTEEKNE
jgi:predicted PurR-regulated permease PerM